MSLSNPSVTFIFYFAKNIGEKSNKLKNFGQNKIIQGDAYSFINILTSGRFRSQKALDNKILNHTSTILAIEKILVL
jgi:hypothetical protein